MTSLSLEVGGTPLWHIQKTPTDAPDGSAGTAGNVIAARLAEDRKNRVLVVEAGRRSVLQNIQRAFAPTHMSRRCSNEGFESDLISTPFLGPQASPGTTFDWNYTTVPQGAIKNQPIAYPRGYVLGGSSSTSESFPSSFLILHLNISIAL